MTLFSTKLSLSSTRHGLSDAVTFKESRDIAIRALLLPQAIADDI